MIVSKLLPHNGFRENVTLCIGLLSNDLRRQTTHSYFGAQGNIWKKKHSFYYSDKSKCSIYAMFFSYFFNMSWCIESVFVTNVIIKQDTSSNLSVIIDGPRLIKSMSDRGVIVSHLSQINLSVLA